MININILLYLDPGSGSMILQAIIAVFLGIAMFLKNIKLYLLHFFEKYIKDSASKTSKDVNNSDERK